VGAGPLPVSDNGLFPAEHRALRELYGTGRHLAGHWDRLAARLGGEPADVLSRGAASAREMLRELAGLTAAHNLHGEPAAQGTGGQLAHLRGAADLLLERNQALRGGVLEAAHVGLLLAYLAELASTRGDTDLAAWHRTWEGRLRELEGAARGIAVAEGRQPERAVEPADDSRLGRAGHSIAAGLGTVGEAIDASPLGRAVRRLRRG
jgi:hypothetical protein